MTESTPLFADREALLSMSGLDFMTAFAEGRFVGATMATTMGFAVDSVAEGRVTFAGAPTAAVFNPMGTVHGRWYGTILDGAMGCAVMTLVPAGSVYTTLEYKINITRAIPLGAEVEAVATVQHSGRSTAVASAELRGRADGKLYATGSTTCIIMKMK